MRNAFFNMLGDTESEQRHREQIRNLRNEFLSYEDDPQKQAQFKEAYPTFANFCFAIQRYWWAKDGDRIKYRKMTSRQRETYSNIVLDINERPKVYLRFGVGYEDTIIRLEKAEERRRRREERQSQKAKQQETLTQPTQT
ncbi:MAG: hypothetical protein OXB93_02280 [Cytophagales bacterium]|nr:hypothetical protein [Cytophagales bacterium]